MSDDERQQLIKACDDAIVDYKSSRGTKIWSHRKLSSGVLSGTLRYEILKRAKFRCELCGISADQKALEVDHILPRNLGGSDDESNLQALCYSCNAMKRDRDDTDFRGMSEAYHLRKKGCVFCDLPSDCIVAENELAVAFPDAYPVTLGHTLIAPKRHAANYFDLYRPELNAIHSLMQKVKEALVADDPEISGFNMGNNSGEDAGQTVFHCHVHLIPRRHGDADNPRGGVRGVIPAKQAY